MTERPLFCCSPCSLSRGSTSLSWPQLYLACLIWLQKPPVITGKKKYQPDNPGCKKLFIVKMLRQIEVMVAEENLSSWLSSKKHVNTLPLDDQHTSVWSSNVSLLFPTHSSGWQAFPWHQEPLVECCSEPKWHQEHPLACVLPLHHQYRCQHIVSTWDRLMSQTCPAFWKCPLQFPLFPETYRRACPPQLSLQLSLIARSY